MSAAGGTIMVFAKAPVAGQVKTRLRRAYGAAGAARVYRHLLARTLATAAAAQPDVLALWVAPGTGHPTIRALARRFGARLHAQPGGDLGRRMHRALSGATRGGRKGLIVGADCAALSPSDLGEAMGALDTAAAFVIKPASDGGYVLVGGRCAPAMLFQGIPWGTARVMAQTRTRLRQWGGVYRELAPGWDVDRPADLHRLRRETGFRAVVGGGR